MAGFTQKNKHEPDFAKYDYNEATYFLPHEEGSLKVRSHPDGDAELGEIRQPDVFETEHHVYSCPFRYGNVQVNNWNEYSNKGIELLADVGTIVIEEQQPIVQATIVGSGCSGNNYNIIEWWGEGESLRKGLKGEKRPGQLIKRQRADNLKGQHPAWVQGALSQELPEFKTLEEANVFLRRMQRVVHAMTANYTVPGSLMTGLYENTVVFRIGDTSRKELCPHRIVIRGGGLDYEDPFNSRNRFPADYTFRLVDVLVKKPAR